MPEQALELDTLIVPTVVAVIFASRLSPHINPYQITGVEAELYPSMSMKPSGRALAVAGETLAEGIAVKVPGQITASIIEKYVDDIVL